MYASKVVEGLASSFIGPCLAALTLASFGPVDFDRVMASNVYWGHVGSVAAAVLAGFVSVVAFPNIQYCFYVIGASALVAIAFVPYLPQGDPLMGRGLATSSAALQRSDSGTDDDEVSSSSSSSMEDFIPPTESTPLAGTTNTGSNDDSELKVASYLDVFMDFKTRTLCLTGFFFQ